jgi:hypothetical protein
MVNQLRAVEKTLAANGQTIVIANATAESSAMPCGSTLTRVR